MMGTHLGQGDDSFAFQNAIELIGREILGRIDRAGWPAYFERVDLSGCAEAKMHAEIVLRNITAAAVNLVGLGHPSGDDFQACANRQSIALLFPESSLPASSKLTQWRPSIP